MTMTCEHCSKPVTGQYCHSCSRAAKKSAGGGTGRKALGLCLIIGPWVGLMIVLSAYAMASFVTSSIQDSRVQSLFIESVYAGRLEAENLGNSGGYNESMIKADDEAREAIGGIVSMMLSLIGLCCIVGIFVGTPVGIYLLATDGKPKAK